MSGLRSVEEPRFADVTAACDVPPGGVVRFEAAGRRFLICNTGARFHAVAERCTHAAWSLAGGELRNDGGGWQLVCGLHGGRFDLRTGEPTALPATKPLRVFPLRTRAGRIEVQLPPRPR